MQSESTTTRRDFLTTSAIAGGLAFAPSLFAGQNTALKIGLVGCGGRGTGAAENALSVARYGPIKMVAMADVFPGRLESSHRELQKRPVAKQMDVPPDRRFIGLDAYQKAIDCLKPGDVAIFATPPAFRWAHFAGGGL